MSRRRAGVIVIIASALLVGAASYIAWRQAEQAERADQRPAPLGPDPHGTDAAVDLARRFYEHLAQRRYAEALPMADGKAAEYVAKELSQRIGEEGQRDPELFKLIDGALAATVSSFEATSVTPQDKGEAVLVRARAVLLGQGTSRTTHPRFLLFWRFDNWAIREYEPDEAAPASAPGPSR